MIKLILLLVFFCSSVFANKVIYLSHEELPSRVIKGEIFPLTIKSLSTVREFSDIDYNFSNAAGVELIEKVPQREIKGKYFYDTFYFLATSSSAKLPDIEASLIASQEYNSTLLSGTPLNIITLNPKKNFSNIIAENFEIVQYKTTSYDKEHNIVIFIASALRSNIKDLHFNNIYKQGIESINESYKESRITYFVILDKKIENFSFSYFNLLKNNFLTLNIPIMVEEDSVATQSDLKPKDESKERLKLLIAAISAAVLLLFILFRKKYIYLFLMLLPVGYIVYIIVPDETLCIKKGARIQLLPVDNGTVFQTTSEISYLQKEGSSAAFKKVKLKNEKIGWVRDEDICSY